MPTFQDGIARGLLCRGHDKGQSATESCCNTGGSQMEYRVCPDGVPVYR